MKSSEVQIINKLGLHARAAARFVQLAKSFSATVEIGPSDAELVNAKSIMSLMTLAAGKGTVLVLRTNGVHEAEAMQALTDLIDDKFGEAE